MKKVSVLLIATGTETASVITRIGAQTTLAAIERKKINQVAITGGVTPQNSV